MTLAQEAQLPHVPTPQGQYDLGGFDVFDTLVTRAVGSPASVFLLLGRQAEVQRLTGWTPEQFARARHAAEVNARRGGGEVTLADIYADIRQVLGLTPAQMDRLQGMEIELELRLARVMPGARDLVMDCPAPRRVAISDMYLPASAVGALLASVGLRDLLDDVHVSSTTGKTKSRGTLFSSILEETAVASTRFIHHGDHPWSDVHVPRRMGARARHIARAELTRYERSWEEAAYATGGMSALVAGASRLARLAAVDEGCDPAIADVACGVAGPAFTAFVIWTLRQAQRAGLRRLYFLARDGEIMLRVAEQLVPRLGLDIELRYLHGSRRAFHRAALADQDPAEARWAWHAMYEPTCLQVLQRLGLDEEAARRLLDGLGIPQRADDVLTSTELRSLLERTDVVAAVRHNALPHRVLLQDYFRQEGLGDGVPYGIVDTGWSGRTIQALSQALPTDVQQPDAVYMFGVMNRPDGWQAPDLIRGFLFDEVARTGFWAEFPRAYGPIETFSAADQGMTIGFRRQGTRVVPALASETNPVLLGWPWADYRRALLGFVEQLELAPDLADVDADLRAPIAAVLRAFWDSPSLEEARAWGRFTYEDDLLGSSRNELARPFRVRDLASKLAKGGSYRGKRLWRAGSLALTRQPVRTVAAVSWQLMDSIRADGARGIVPARVRAARRRARAAKAIRR